jgi:hypothetical protein
MAAIIVMREAGIPAVRRKEAAEAVAPWCEGFNT